MFKQLMNSAWRALRKQLKARDLQAELFAIGRRLGPKLWRDVRTWTRDAFDQGLRAEVAFNYVLLRARTKYGSTVKTELIRLAIELASSLVPERFDEIFGTLFRDDDDEAGRGPGTRTIAQVGV